MSRATQLAVTVGLMAVLLSACGISAKPQAGTGHLTKDHGYYGLVDNPRTKHAKCLTQNGLKIHDYFTAGQGYPAIQVGTLPKGPTIIFYPTPGAAQYLQIHGQAQGAEAIGSALLYPNHATDAELTVVEDCTAIGVSG
jgi:hypothetical protein